MKRRNNYFIQLSLISLILFSLAVSSCSLEATENNENNSIIDSVSKECFCTSDYDPVCGVDGKTYSNKCKADCLNVEVEYIGECES